MTYRTLKLALMVILMTVAPLGLAAEPLDKAELDTLRAALNVGGVEIISAQMSEMPGVVEVQLKAGPLVYSTLKGDFFIVGDLYSVGPAGYVNLAEQRRDQERVEILAKVDRPTNKMIKRLKRRWKSLHQLIYVVAILAILHFIWLVKKDMTEPIIYAKCIYI